MFLNEKNQKIRIVLSDGSAWESAKSIERIEYITDDDAQSVQKGPFEYVLIKAYKADADKDIIKRVVEIELDLLRKLGAVCEEHGLRLYMIYGTLLGAVRHGGVIPGDDDIDVALLREDYDKLIQLTDEFQGKYFLQTPDNDEAFFGGYIKLRNRETTAVHEQNRWASCVEGIGIDIFPIDKGYENLLKEKIKLAKICFYQRLMYAHIYGEARNYMDMPLLIWKAYKYLGKILGKDRIVRGLDRALRSGDVLNSSKSGIYTHYTMGKRAYTFSSEYIGSGTSMMYEDMSLLAPDNYKELLRLRYGKNYMNLPLQENVVKMRHGLYDVERSYLEYQKHVTCFFSKLPKDKTIILVGDRLICAEYVKQRMSKYPAKYWVEAATVSYGSIEGLKIEKVLEDSNVLDSIELKTFDDLKKADYNKVFPFVCVFDYKKGFEMMRTIGCEDYFFYQYNAGWMRISDPLLVAKQYMQYKGMIQEEE